MSFHPPSLPPSLYQVGFFRLKRRKERLEKERASTGVTATTTGPAAAGAPNDVELDSKPEKVYRGSCEGWREGGEKKRRRREGEREARREEEKRGVGIALESEREREGGGGERVEKYSHPLPSSSLRRN